MRVYTIGFGTPQGATLVCSREQMGSDVFGPQFGAQGGRPADGPRRSFLVIDEPTLQKVADMTGGKYHRAADARQLVQIFRDLPTEIALQDEEVELSAAFAALGALLAAAAVGLSLAWNRYS